MGPILIPSAVTWTNKDKATIPCQTHLQHIQKCNCYSKETPWYSAGQGIAMDSTGWQPDGHLPLPIHILCVIDPQQLPHITQDIDAFLDDTWMSNQDNNQQTLATIGTKAQQTWLWHDLLCCTSGDSSTHKSACGLCSTGNSTHPVGLG